MSENGSATSMDKLGRKSLLDVLPRLVYLSAEVRPAFPLNGMMKLVPQGDLLKTIATKGIAGAQTELRDVTKTQLMSLYSEGSEYGGKASEEEFRTLVSQLCIGELETIKSTLTFSQYLDYLGRIRDYYTKETETMVAVQEMSFADEDNEEPPIVKFNTGFAPLDTITGGFYNGIVMIVAPPGHGKTTMSFSLVEEMRKKTAKGLVKLGDPDFVSSIWFMEMELSLAMVRYKTYEMRKRTKFLKDDWLRCGDISIKDVLDKVQHNPDPNRVVIIDSPDAMSQVANENKRFELEKIYRDLVRIKDLSKMVIVTSQPRRSDSNRTLKLESPAESWSKSQLVDIMIGIRRHSRGQSGHTKVEANVVKNRFGPPDRFAFFQYEYQHLLWEYDGKTEADDEENW